MLLTASYLDFPCNSECNVLILFKEQQDGLLSIIDLKAIYLQVNEYLIVKTSTPTPLKHNNRTQVSYQQFLKESSSAFQEQEMHGCGLVTSTGNWLQ